MQIRLAFLSSMIGTPLIATAQAIVAASPSSSVSIVLPATSFSKCPELPSSSGNALISPRLCSSATSFASFRLLRVSSCSSPSATSEITKGFGNALRIATAQPVALRLMTVLASQTTVDLGSLRQDSPIGVAPFDLKAIKHLPDFDPIKVEHPS